jgi:hypothetical protein
MLPKNQNYVIRKNCRGIQCWTVHSFYFKMLTSPGKRFFNKLLVVLISIKNGTGSAVLPYF